MFLLDAAAFLLEAAVLEEAVFDPGGGGRFGAGVGLFADVFLVLEEILGLGEVAGATGRGGFGNRGLFLVDVGEFLVWDFGVVGFDVGQLEMRN